MGCTNCSSSNGLPKGCKNNGSCGVGGCGKMPVFDWLSNMQLPSDTHSTSYVEVRFKNGRKEFFHNKNRLSLHIGEAVVVETRPGFDVGIVSLHGELVRFQMRKRSIEPSEENIYSILRVANQHDLDMWHEQRERENQLMMETRSIARRLNLEMKVSDVEIQADGSKGIFFYTAEDRVDFRVLIKEMAAAFKLRVEMRQIGLRQEAARLGGIGSCGRELCCSTWLTDFRSVSTAAARYQQLSLNPQKLAGQCGKLKCCLNYELDSYIEEVKKFPDTNKKLKTKSGEAYFQKMDIFRGLMWYTIGKDSPVWYSLNYKDAAYIQAINEEGQQPDDLEQFAVKLENTETTSAYSNVVGQDDLSRFDKANSGNSRKKRNNPRRTNKPDSRDNRNSGKMN